MLVVAGPGSGKTTVLTHRIQYLIEQYHVRPEEILVITFTKAAAMQMKERFERLMGKKLPVAFGTFHAVFFKILRAAYNYSADNIVKEDVRKQILEEAAAAVQMDSAEQADFWEQLSGEISKVKSEGLDIAVYNSAKFPAEEFQKVYRYYTNALRKKRLLDFDDMLLYCQELLQSRPDILAGWQKKFRYILIDEFQDINKIQYEVIRMLARPENNLFIVGDDDQSIYGFRGSRPEIMLRFEQDYPYTKKVILDVNYRSAANIVKASACVIANNAVRFQKNIHTWNGAGEPVDIVEFPTQPEQYARIADTIRAGVAAGHAYSDYAVLFRTNALATPLVRKMMEKNIPFLLRDGLPDIFEHWIAKDFLAYMMLAAGSRKRSDFLRIMNRPLRYIGRDYLTESEISFTELEKYYEEKPWMIKRLDQLQADLKRMSAMAPYACINYIRKGVGYDDFLKNFAEEHGLDFSELNELADEIQDSSRESRSLADWLEYIVDYARNLKESREKFYSDRRGTDAVALTTMHSAKGLEYHTVFIIDANEGITPYKKSVFPTEIEEERRMFYVAMTRAKAKLHIFYTKERYNKQLSPSRFVNEIVNYSSTGVSTK